jgi:hypothetical protein
MDERTHAVCDENVKKAFPRPMINGLVRHPAPSRAEAMEMKVQMEGEKLR